MVFVTGLSLANDTAEDYATIEHSRNGKPISTHRCDGPASDSDIADAIAVGQNGDVLVTGYSNGTNGGPDIVRIK